MEMTPGIFMFVIALSAVVNGLGIARIVGGMGELLRRQHSLTIRYYWPHTLLVLFQLLAHMLLWWSFIGLRQLATINFLQFLYLLIGPVLLYLATSLLVPDLDDDSADLREDYWSSCKSYYTILAIFWPWAMFIWPAFGHPMAPTWKFALGWMAIILILRFTNNEKAHLFLVGAIWLLMIAFIGIYAMTLGGVASQMLQ